MPTGFAELDPELPGGGWPRGAVIELLLTQTGVGELSLLLPALREATQEGHVALIGAPALLPHAPAWAAHLPLSRLLVVEARGMDVVWSTEQLQASGACSALLAWLPPDIPAKAIRRLQVGAEGKRAPVFMFRPAQAASQSSAAPLRIALSGSWQGLALRILKRRGPPCERVLHLPVQRPVGAERVARRHAEIMDGQRHSLAKI